MAMLAKKKVSRLSNQIADLRIDPTIRTLLSSIIIVGKLIISSQLMVGCLPKSNTCNKC